MMRASRVAVPRCRRLLRAGFKKPVDAMRCSLAAAADWRAGRLDARERKRIDRAASRWLRDYERDTGERVTFLDNEEEAKQWPA